MELDIPKTNIISFTRKTNCVHFIYYISNVLILRSDWIKDLGVMLDSKMYFHCHVNFVYSQELKTLGLTRYVTNNVSSLSCLVISYNPLIGSKLDYASVVWDNITLTDSNNTENIQQIAICFIVFFQSDILRNYDLI
jgi:hypothetical protein